MLVAAGADPCAVWYNSIACPILCSSTTTRRCFAFWTASRKFGTRMAAMIPTTHGQSDQAETPQDHEERFWNAFPRRRYGTCRRLTATRAIERSRWHVRRAVDALTHQVPSPSRHAFRVMDSALRADRAEIIRRAWTKPGGKWTPSPRRLRPRMAAREPPQRTFGEGSATVLMLLGHRRGLRFR